MVAVEKVLQWPSGNRCLQQERWIMGHYQEEGIRDPNGVASGVEGDS